jgi:hypothetical protein
VRVSRYWVGAQNAMAPVQSLTSPLPYVQSAAAGFFGRRHKPGIAALDVLEDDVSVFPSDGRRLLPPVSVPPVGGNFRAFKISAIDRPGHPSDLAIAGRDGFLGDGVLAVYSAAKKP